MSRLSLGVQFWNQAFEWDEFAEGAAAVTVVGAGFTTVIAQTAAPLDLETIDRLIGEVRPLVESGA